MIFSSSRVSHVGRSISICGVCVSPNLTSLPENDMNQTTLALRARDQRFNLFTAATLAALDKTVLNFTKPTAAVCVAVPNSMFDDQTALRILTGSTMNDTYVDEATARDILTKLRARAGAETTLTHTNVDYIGDRFDFGGGEKQSHVMTARRDGNGVLQTAHYDVQVGGKKAIKKQHGPCYGAGKKIDLSDVMNHMLGELPVAQHLEPPLTAGVPVRRTVHPAFH